MTPSLVTGIRLCSYQPRSRTAATLNVAPYPIGASKTDSPAAIQSRSVRSFAASNASSGSCRASHSM